MHAVRLDPAKLMPFDVKPGDRARERRRAHDARAHADRLGRARWDCALGRLTGDVSAFGVVLSNAAGTLFWAVAKALTGDVWEQCRQIKAVVLELQLPRVVVETNGPGAFAPAVLKKVLHGTGCGWPKNSPPRTRTSASSTPSKRRSRGDSFGRTST
jgi:hypothetical protein